jgi:hypothetical protein
LCRNPCYSDDNPVSRDGTGYWDYDSAEKSMFTAAASNVCGAVALCTLTNHSTGLQQTQSMYTVNFPIGDNVINTSSPKFLYIYFVVDVSENTPGTQQTHQVLSIVSVQLPVSTATILNVCPQTIVSRSVDTDYVSVNLAIGTQTAEAAISSRGAIIFSDIAHTVGEHNTATITETSQLYTASTTMDALLTFVLSGDPVFFSSHSAYEVNIDHMILVHVRNEEKYTNLLNELTYGQAYIVSTNNNGVSSISLDANFVYICQNDITPTNIDCVIQHAVHNRIANDAIARELHSAMLADILWMLDEFGDTSYMRRVATEFLMLTKSRFTLDYQTKKAYIVVPTYNWPVSQIALKDHTITILSFSVDRHVASGTRRLLSLLKKPMFREDTVQQPFLKVQVVPSIDIQRSRKWTMPMKNASSVGKSYAPKTLRDKMKHLA